MKHLSEWPIERLLSVRDLADLAGVSTKTAVQLEHGRQQPTFRTMRRICQALQVEPNQVIEFAKALRRRRGSD